MVGKKWAATNNEGIDENDHDVVDNDGNNNNDGKDSLIWELVLNKRCLLVSSLSSLVSVQDGIACLSRGPRSHTMVKKHLSLRQLDISHQVW